MATTTKTLTPTNQTITLPDMTERPDASVLVDGIGKEGDAINALSDQMSQNSNEAGTIIPAGSDLNSYTTPGNYFINSISDANNIANKPVASSGRLEVIRSVAKTDSRFYQTFYSNSIPQNIYTRNYTASGWSDWYSASDKISDLGSTTTTLTVTTVRGTKLSGGAYVAGKLVVINFTFKAIATAANSPGIASISKTPLNDVALSVIDITSGITSAITGSIPCGIGTNGTIYIKEITTDHIYAVSGVVVCS